MTETVWKWQVEDESFIRKLGDFDEWEVWVFPVVKDGNENIIEWGYEVVKWKGQYPFADSWARAGSNGFTTPVEAKWAGQRKAGRLMVQEEAEEWLMELAYRYE